MPPPRARQHLRPPLSRRARHTTTTTALPNSGLGSARPFVRWINLRDVRRQDQASVWRARAGMTDCQEIEPIGWRLPRVALRRLRPQERSSLTSTVALRSIRCSGDPVPGGTVKAPAGRLRRPGPSPANGTKAWHRSTGKTASFKRIRAQRLQRLGIIYIVVDRAARRKRA